MIKRGFRGLPGMPGGLPDIDIPTSGLGGIDASIFPTFQVRSVMPPLPGQPGSAPVKAAGSGNTSDAPAQQGQSGQPNRQGGK